MLGTCSPHRANRSEGLEANFFFDLEAPHFYSCPEMSGKSLGALGHLRHGRAMVQVGKGLCPHSRYLPRTRMEDFCFLEQ